MSGRQDEDHTVDVPSVTRFAWALHRAVHDAKHENRPGSTPAARDAGTTLDPGVGRVVHYWDTDSLFWPAFGFLADRRRSVIGDWSDDKRIAASQADPADELLVGALFSSGFLGAVQLVPAHRIEFSSVVMQFAHNRASEKYNYRRALRSFTQRHRLNRVLDDIVQAVNQVDPAAQSITEAAKLAVSRLNRIDRRSFALIESLSGTWDQRLRRLLDPATGLLKENVTGPSTEEVRESRYLELFWDGLREVRGDRSRDTQTAVDAAALAAIAIMNERANRRRNGVFPRFHTKAPSIWRLFETNKEAYDAFTFSYAAPDGTTQTDTILRDGYTYVLRAMFPTLAPPGALLRAADPGPSRESLEELSAVLMAALGADRDSLRDFVATTHIGSEQSVAGMIADIESSAMTTIWLRYTGEDFSHAMPPGLADLRDGLRAIHRLDSIEATRDLAYGFLESASDILRTQVSDLALGSQISDRLSRAWPRGTTDRDLSLSLDFAAVRWGVRPHQKQDRVVAVEEHLQLRDIEWLRRDTQAAERALAILLALDEYSLALRLHQTLITGSVSESDSTFVMGAACRAMLTKVDQLPTLILEVERQIKDAVPEQLDRLAMGYGFIYFHAWRRSGFAASQAWGENVPALLFERWPSDPLGWAQRSFDLVAAADTGADVEGESNVAAAFRLNHQVYVSSVAGLRRTAIATHWQRLEELIESGMRQPRFLDTVAQRRYLVALRAFTDVRTRPTPEWLAEHKDSLRKANSLFEEALRARPADATIRDHRQRLDQLALNVGIDLRKDRGGP